MAYIVELRDMSYSALEEKLEEAREELFNLRFRQAVGQVEDSSLMPKARRELAQLLTVLNGRKKAISLAANVPEVQNSLTDQEWQADARFDYKSGLYTVDFEDDAGNTLATAQVDINKKRRGARKARRLNAAPRRVFNVEAR